MTGRVHGRGTGSCPLSFGPGGGFWAAPPDVVRPRGSSVSGSAPHPEGRWGVTCRVTEKEAIQPVLQWSSALPIVVSSVWLASETAVAWRTWRVRRSFTDAAPRDGGSAWVVLAGTAVAGTALVVLSSQGWARVGMSGQGVGLGLMLGGIVLRWAAVLALGRHFSLFVATSASQSLVTSGPYRVVRHPAYSGVLFTSAGLGLVYGSWLAAAFLAGAAWALFSYRIRVEEAVLVAHFGPTYVAYRARTWRLIPWIF